MIRVEHLTKAYGSLKAIDDLSFNIERGEIVGFLGPNGAGKSTTMRILTGSLGATSGRALIAGLDVMERPKQVKRMIGYLPEFPPLYTDMTATDYLRYCARIKGAETPKKAVEEVIDKVGLREVATRLIAHLSKGYRQRVGIAQALVHSPEVLILDEPASGLDPAQRVEIRDLVRELAQGDTTVLLSTHVLPEVEAICSRVIIIHKGQIVAQNSVNELAESGRSTLVRVARPDANTLAALSAIAGVDEVEPGDDGRFVVRSSSDVREAVAAAAVGFGLLEMRSQQALEDVFLQLTRSDEEEVEA